MKASSDYNSIISAKSNDTTVISYCNISVTNNNYIIIPSIASLNNINESLPCNISQCSVTTSNYYIIDKHSFH